MLEDLENIDIQNSSFKIQHSDKVYFIGIGGIGMSAIARWFNANGKRVAGYDRTQTLLTDKLVEEGIAITFEDSESTIPEEFKENTLVVYTPAIPEDNVQYNYFKSQNIELYKRSQVLGMITEDYLTIAVAGTHGKTTTSTMIAHLLHSAGEECTAFLGGISTNLNSNLLLAKNDLEQIIVVEADEFDRSFLTLFPDIAVVTSVEADHLDIYGKADSLVDSFKKFAAKIDGDGTLIVQNEFASHFNADFNYSKSEGDYYAENRRVENGRVYFDAKTPDGYIRNIPLNQPGHHNMENALAAIAVAQQLDIPKKKIIEAFETYSGVKRRFEYVVKSDNFTYIDDYAHHPTEIKAFLSSIKELYPDKKLTAIFQPHLYSRTRDFAEGFSESLSIADELILLDIYPARELPIEGVNSEMLVEKITCDVQLSKKEQVISLLKEKNNLEVLVTVGAGDIDTLVAEIKNNETFFIQKKVKA